MKIEIVPFKSVEGEKKSEALKRIGEESGWGRGRLHTTLLRMADTRYTEAIRSIVEKGGVVEARVVGPRVFHDQWNVEIEGNKPMRICDYHVFLYAFEDELTGDYRDTFFGYYIRRTPEIDRLRRAVLQCGYCGAQYVKDCDRPWVLSQEISGFRVGFAPSDGFCRIHSHHRRLQEHEFYLLKLHPVSHGLSRRGDKKIEIPPDVREGWELYERERLQRGIEEDYERVIKEKIPRTKLEAEISREINLWLLERGFLKHEIVRAIFDSSGLVKVLYRNFNLDTCERLKREFPAVEIEGTTYQIRWEPRRRP